METNQEDLKQTLLGGSNQHSSESEEKLKFQNTYDHQNLNEDNDSDSSSSFDPDIYNIPDIDVGKSAVRRLILVSIVCLLLMIGKFVGGIIANSLAILTDAAHMFSDLTGFIISLISLFIARKPANTAMSYGYHRAEVIGAMASVILIWGLTAWLVTEATERIVKMDYTINGLVMLITAVLGLLTNLLMFNILHSGGHGHSHGGHECPSHGHKQEKKKLVQIQDFDFAEDQGLNEVEKDKGELEKMIKNMKKKKAADHGHSHAHSSKKDKTKEKHKEKTIEMQNEPMSNNEDSKQFADDNASPVEHKHPECETKKNKKHEHKHDEHDKEHHDEEETHSQRSENLSIIEEADNPNLRAAWIHMLGDTISSFGAVIASIIIYFWQSWKIVDPICTYFFAILVLFTTFPISRDCILVLMEGTPVGISIEDFEKELKNIKGVISVHDIHIWQLSAGKPSMSCHLIAKDTNLALKKATKLCRQKGIYHSTIQIEDVLMINQVDAIKCNQNIH